MSAPSNNRPLYTKHPAVKEELENFYREGVPARGRSSSALPAADSSLSSLGTNKGSRRKASLPNLRKLFSIPREDIAQSSSAFPEHLKRFSGLHENVEILLNVELPEDPGEAVEQIRSYFSTSINSGEAALRVIKTILKYPEKEEAILRALEEVYVEVLKANSPAQKDQFFDELLHIISYDTPKTIGLVSKFFMKNLENGCQRSDHPKILPDERSIFVSKLFAFYEKKREFKKLFAAIVGIDIQNATTDTILREDCLSTNLANFAISRCLQGELDKTAKKLGATKKGIPWEDQHQITIDAAASLMNRLEKSTELREISVLVADKVREQFFSEPQDKQEELARRVLCNFIFLRAVNPYFVHFQSQIGIQFAKFLQAIATGDEAYQINTLDSIPKIEKANLEFKKAFPGLQKSMKDLLSFLAGSGGVTHNPLRGEASSPR